MPVTIRGVPFGKSAPPPKNRCRPLDSLARKLSPVLAELRRAGIESVEETMAALNTRGVAKPKGKPFTFGATHRLMWRVYELGLGPRPRSVSQALSARPIKKLAKLRREHPEWYN